MYLLNSTTKIFYCIIFKNKTMLTLKALDIDYRETFSKINNFIKLNVEESKLNGAIISASGGIDSTVLLYLTVEALGKENIIALMIPERDITLITDINDVIDLTKQIGVTIAGGVLIIKN